MAAGRVETRDLRGKLASSGSSLPAYTKKPRAAAWRNAWFCFSNNRLVKIYQCPATVVGL